MATMNSYNVFKGPDSVKNYFNPDLNPPLPLVEIPAKFNPFHEDGVRIYAKMMTTLPAQNVKMLPALNMIQNQPEAAVKSIVEASSGSTVLSLGILSQILWNRDDVSAYVTNKKHPDSLRLLRFFGLKIGLYGGLAQQDPDDTRGIMSRLRRRNAEEHNICYLGQYDNEHNWKAHVRWTGNQIWRQLPEINVFCTTVGTGGAITGTGVYLKSQKPSVKVVGVCNTFGDPTPGPRHFPGFESCQFPWRTTIDKFETVSSVDAYRMSMNLCRNGIIAGPSSGEALVGLLDYLRHEKQEGRLHDLADPITGEISCVFMCCDLPYQYLDGYYQKLDEAVDFPPILNKELLDCDTYRYDERWELQPDQAMHILKANDELRSAKSHFFSLDDDILEQALASNSIGGQEIPTSRSSSPPTSCSSMSSSEPDLDTLDDLSLSYHPSSSDAPSTRSSVSSMASFSCEESQPKRDEVDISVSARIISSIPPVILDLRQSSDFHMDHIPSAINIPLPNLTPSTPDIFGNDTLLQQTWHNLHQLLGVQDDKHSKNQSSAPGDQTPMSGLPQSVETHLQDKSSTSTILLVCYDGETSRMATSILREKYPHHQTYSVYGGMTSLQNHICKSLAHA